VSGKDFSYSKEVWMKKGLCLVICLFCLFGFAVPAKAVDIPYQDLNGDWEGNLKLTDSSIDLGKLAEVPTALPSEAPSEVPTDSLGEGCDQLMASMGPALKEIFTQLAAGVPVTVNLAFDSPTSGQLSFTKMDLKMPEGTSSSDTSSPIPFQYNNGRLTSDQPSAGIRNTLDGTISPVSGGYQLSATMRVESLDSKPPWYMNFSLDVSRTVEGAADSCSGSINWLDAIQPGEVLRPVAVYTDGKNSFTPKSQEFRINGIVKRAILWDGSEIKVELQFTCPHGKSYTVSRTLLPADPTTIADFGSDTEVQIQEIQNIKISRFHDGVWVSVTDGQLQVGDRISAGSSGGSILLDKTFGVNTDTLFQFKPNTELQVVKPASPAEWLAARTGGQTFFDLYKGTLRIIGSVFGVKTAQVVTVNSQTDWAVEVGIDDTRVTVFEGMVLVGLEAGGSPLEVAAGSSVSATGENLGSLQPFDSASELAGWNAIPGVTSSPLSPSPSTTLPPSATPPTVASPSATAPPIPQPTGSGTFLGLSTQWWIIGGAGLGVLLLAILVLVLVARSGKRKTQLTAAPYASSPSAQVPITPCPQCRYPIPPDQRFCGNCGADKTISQAPAAIQAALPSDKCPNCGVETVPGGRFCENCGADLTTPTVIPVSPAAEAHVCPSCGAALISGSTFCGVCGKSVPGS
jgi:hypothetical protein